MQSLPQWEALALLAESSDAAELLACTARWWVDINGMAHGVEEHGTSEVTATLAELVAAPRHARCATVLRCAGSDGVAAATFAQRLTAKLAYINLSDETHEAPHVRLHRALRNRTQLAADMGMAPDADVGAQLAQRALDRLDEMVREAYTAATSADARRRARITAARHVLFHDPSTPWAALREFVNGSCDVPRYQLESLFQEYCVSGSFATIRDWASGLTPTRIEALAQLDGAAVAEILTTTHRQENLVPVLVEMWRAQVGELVDAVTGWFPGAVEAAAVDQREAVVALPVVINNDVFSAFADIDAYTSSGVVLRCPVVVAQYLAMLVHSGSWTVLDTPFDGSAWEVLEALVGDEGYAVSDLGALVTAASRLAV